MANAFRTPQELALAADHHLALAAISSDHAEAQAHRAEAAQAVRLMWAATAREQGWS